MIAFAIIGCAICILVAIACITFIIATMNDNAITDVHADDVLTGLIISVILFVFIFSIAFVHFKFYPEKYGYTAIETEVEEVEDADTN